MATIKCKSCGRAYNYRSSELCPKCGAFNRPPHRMRVGFNADGGVELQTEKEFVREAQRFDARDDVCAEGQARKVRNSDTLIDSETLDALGKQLNKWGGQLEKWWTENSQKSTPVAKDSPLRDRKKGKSSGSKAVAIIAAVSILVSLLGTIMESCESNRIHAVPEPDVSFATEQVAPTEVYWSEEHYQRILETYAVSKDVPMGEVFEWYGTKLWLGGWELSGDSGDNFMVVSVNSNEAFPVEHLDDCFLLWVDWDGTEWVFTPEKFQNGALIFRYLHTETMPEGTLCWLIFNDFDENGNWTGNTTAVSLVEHDGYFSDAPYDDSSTEAIALWSEEEKKELLDRHGVTEICNIGSTFICEGQKIAVTGWGVNDNNGDSFMEVSVEADDEYIEDMLSKWYLLWLDSDGYEWVYSPAAHRDGELVFTDLHTTYIDENTPIWLLCEQYEQYDAVGQYISTTAVELN